MPHGYCYQWDPLVVWVHVISDSVIALSYFWIPVTMLYFIVRNRVPPLNRIFWLVGSFVLACGTTHLLEVWNVWHHNYLLSGLLKALTASVSLLTAAILVPLMPKVFSLPDRVQLQESNRRLKREIAERKQAEKALRQNRARLDAALASMTDAVFISDAEGRFIEFNDSFATFHRFKSKAECATTLAGYPNFLDVFMPNGELAPLDMWAVPRALRGEIATNAEYTLRRKPTGETWIGSYSFGPIRDGNGAIVGSVVTARDITQTKANELEIRKLNVELEHRVAERTARLEASNKELEAFTYSVSHDLRAPLRHIGGFARILEEDFGPSMSEEARQHLRHIVEGTHHMSVLVDELLNLSRVGCQALDLRETNLNSVIEEVVSLLTPEIQERTVTWKIESLTPAACDPILIKQVFQNLLANALKFTRTRERTVIAVSQQEVNGETVIMVSDNGVGFNMKYRDKLFGVFQRLHRAEDFEGTGIGLATVQRIIHNHGGRVWAEAEPDQGARLYFTLGGEGKEAAPRLDANRSQANAGN